MALRAGRFRRVTTGAGNSRDNEESHVTVYTVDPVDEIEELGLVEALMLSTGPMPSLQELLGRPVWQKDAACRGEGVAQFFPPEGTSLIRARRICNSCSVSEQCLKYAIERPSLKGVWAGTSERRRRRLRAQALAGDSTTDNLTTPAAKEVV